MLSGRGERLSTGDCGSGRSRFEGFDVTHAELFSVLWDWLDEADRITNANSGNDTLRPREVFARALVNVQAKASSDGRATVSDAPWSSASK